MRSWRRVRGMSLPASSPPSRLISDELWALVEPLIPAAAAGGARSHRPPAGLRSGRARGHRLRAVHRHRLDQAAGRAGLRLGLNLLAPDARVGPGRAVRPAARGSAPPAGRARAAGLIAGQPGLGQRPREKGGALTGPNPTDRGKAGSKYHGSSTPTGYRSTS